MSALQQRHRQVMVWAWCSCRYQVAIHLPDLLACSVYISCSCGWPKPGMGYTTLSLHSSIVLPLSSVKVSFGRSPIMGGTIVLCMRNLPLHSIFGGYFRWALWVNLTTNESRACITPVLGSTQYMFGAVVLSLKPIWCSVLLTTFRSQKLCFFSSTRNLSSSGWTDINRLPPPPLLMEEEMSLPSLLMEDKMPPPTSLLMEEDTYVTVTFDGGRFATVAFVDEFEQIFYFSKPHVHMVIVEAIHSRKQDFIECQNLMENTLDSSS